MEEHPSVPVGPDRESEKSDNAVPLAGAGVVAGSGAGTGLLLGRVLTEFLSWRWTMFVNVAIAALALVGALPVLPLLVGAAIFAIFLLLMYYLEDIPGHSPVLTGFAPLSMPLGIVVPDSSPPPSSYRSWAPEPYRPADLPSRHSPSGSPGSPRPPRAPASCFRPSWPAWPGMRTAAAMSIGTYGVARQDAGPRPRCPSLPAS